MASSSNNREAGGGYTQEVSRRMFGNYSRISSSLNERVVNMICALASDVAPLRSAPQHIQSDPRQSLDWVIQTTYSNAHNKNLAANVRRTNYQTFLQLLSKIDEHNNAIRTRQQTSGTAETNQHASEIVSRPAAPPEISAAAARQSLSRRVCDASTSTHIETLLDAVLFAPPTTEQVGAGAVHPSTSSSAAPSLPSVGGLSQHSATHENQTAPAPQEPSTGAEVTHPPPRGQLHVASNIHNCNDGHQPDPREETIPVSATKSNASTAASSAAAPAPVTFGRINSSEKLKEMRGMLQTVMRTCPLGAKIGTGCLKSTVGSALRQTYPDRFPTRDILQTFFAEAIAGCIVTESRGGASHNKILTLSGGREKPPGGPAPSQSSLIRSISAPATSVAAPSQNRPQVHSSYASLAAAPEVLRTRRPDESVTSGKRPRASSAAVNGITNRPHLLSDAVERIPTPPQSHITNISSGRVPTSPLRRNKVRTAVSRTNGEARGDADQLRPPSFARSSSTNGMRRNTENQRNSLTQQPDLLYLCLAKFPDNDASDTEAKEFIAKSDKHPLVRKSSLSGSLTTRDETNLIFRQPSVPKLVALETVDRLSRWDPCFEFTGPVIIGRMGKVQKNTRGIRTAMQVSFRPNEDFKPPVEELFKLVPFPMWNNPQRGARVDGEAYLILRTLPPEPPQAKDRHADGHIWPLGTFIQLDGEPQSIVQRKQQAHDETKWKHSCDGYSEFFDLTSKIPDPREPHSVSMCCYDDQEFLFCLSVSKFRSTERLFLALTSDGSPERIHTLSHSDGMDKIMHLACPVSVDSEEEDNNDRSNGKGKTRVSLKCPFTQEIMKTPVRGKKCKHFQCFDLAGFLETHRRPSSGRWRCGICDNFISTRDLSFCALTNDILQDVSASVNLDRHGIEFDTNGKYHLLPSNENNKQARQQPSALRPDVLLSTRDQSNRIARPKVQQQEIIEIDDGLAAL